MPVSDPAHAIEGHRALLLAWYHRAKRALPWRETRDPWAVWVSEVMLQQTRVDTVVPYYHRFLERFGSPEALASATEQEALALWSGLGYYRRARLLQAGARAVVAEHGGVVPADHAQLRGLPGVGAYTAGAIGSIAFGLRVPLVDGNVERVLTRLHGLSGDPRTPPLRQTLWALAARYADHEDPGAVNQGLMELGALVCLPQNPQCLTCALRDPCAARAEGTPERWPEKAPKKVPRAEAWSALVAKSEGKVWLVESPRGRWEGMLVPPMVAGDEAALLGSLGLTLAPERVQRRGVVTHVLTHARMQITVYETALDGAPPHARLYPLAGLNAQAVPTMTAKVLEFVDGVSTKPPRRAGRRRGPAP